MKFAAACLSAVVTSPVIVLGFVYEAAAAWFEIGRDLADDWIHQ